MAIFSVSTATELTNALATATGGDRIELAPGDYGDVVINGVTFSSDVTITSADPSAMASLNTLKVNHSSHLVFDQIEVDFTADLETRDFSTAVRVDHSNHITFRDSVIEGDTAKAGADPNSAADEVGNQGIEGYAIGRAMQFGWSDNVTVEGTEMSGFRSGLALMNGENFSVSGNTFEAMRTVPLLGANIDNVEVFDNHFSETVPWHSPSGGGDHGDYIHFWTTQAQDTPNSNITISDNFFEGGNHGVLGIYLDDNFQSKGYDGVVIENNLIHAGHAQGIWVEHGHNMLIKDNTLLANNTDFGSQPGILLSQGGSNIHIANNVTSRIAGEPLDTAAANNITMDGNLLVQAVYPEQEGYITQYFVNPLAENGSPADFMVLPGTAAVGVGASITQYDPSQGAVAMIDATTGDGLDMQRVDVSIEQIYGPANAFDLHNKDVTWDFGDGTTVAGLSASHAYLVPGEYDITATVDTGTETLTLGRTVIVESPYALDVDFETGFEDLTLVENSISADGDGEVRLEATEMGTSARLDADAMVRVMDTDELFDNKEFSIGLDFSTASGSPDDGMLIYFSANVYVRFEDGELSVRGLTDAGETFTLLTDGANLNDGQWHQMIYTFDQPSGQAKLYVDGSEVDQVSGIEGAQKSGIGQDFFIGNPFGGSFTGHTDNLSFVRAALTPEQVEQEYLSFEAELSGTSGGEAGIINASAALDADNDTPTVKELEDLQAAIAEKQAYIDGPSQPEPEGAAAVAGSDEANFNALLHEVYGLMAGLDGNTPQALQAQLFGPITASGNAGVSASGDEDDLYTLLPATGPAEDSGSGDEDLDSDPLSLAH